jgi:hypothetical protein
MGLDQRVSKLEAAQTAAAQEEWKLILPRLTDDELIALEACCSKSVETEKPLTDFITPELEAALERVKR